MDTNGRSISQQGWIQGLLIACLIVIAGCAAPAVMADTPLFFPEQKIFQSTNEQFIQWKNGEHQSAGALLSGYAEISKDKCKTEYGADFEADGRCKVRSIIQSVAVYDSFAERTEDHEKSALLGIKAALGIIKNRKLQPKPVLQFGKVHEDEFRNASDELLWTRQRAGLVEQGIIVGDPICDAYERSVPHFMRAKEYESAAFSARFTLDLCEGKISTTDEKGWRVRQLGQLAEAYAGTKEFDKAIAAAKERYYLLPTEEAANSYLKLLNPKVDKKEIANVTEYQAKIRSKLDRWLKLYPRPTEGELSDYLVYDQLKVSLYKNALAATEKLGLKGYDPYLFSEYELALESANSTKQTMKTLKAHDEILRKQHTESDQAIGEFFDIIEGVQRLRR